MKLFQSLFPREPNMQQGQTFLFSWSSRTDILVASFYFFSSHLHSQSLGNNRVNCSLSCIIFSGEQQASWLNYQAAESKTRAGMGPWRERLSCGSWNHGEDRGTASHRCLPNHGGSMEKHPGSSLSPILQYFTTASRWLKLAGNQGRLGNVVCRGELPAIPNRGEDEWGVDLKTSRPMSG